MIYDVAIIGNGMLDHYWRSKLKKFSFFVSERKIRSASKAADSGNVFGELDYWEKTHISSKKLQLGIDSFQNGKFIIKI